jgi:Ser/Thr protein kinase RdoA (MazF antagonist)
VTATRAAAGAPAVQQQKQNGIICQHLTNRHGTFLNIFQESVAGTQQDRTETSASVCNKMVQVSGHMSMSTSDGS